MPQKPVISIVDDDRSVRDGTADLLMAMGYIAEVFQRADEFLQSSSFERTSCLISDVRVPGMTGLELHNHLVRSGYNIPTILITAFPNERDRASAMSTGVTCYLTKPFRGDDLVACIQAAFEPRGASAPPRAGAYTCSTLAPGQ
jgi:FixJ family two-component response regulator